MLYWVQFWRAVLELVLLPNVLEDRIYLFTNVTLNKQNYP